jgi:hypothetical protein
VSKVYGLYLVNSLVKFVFIYVVASLVFSMILWYFSSDTNAQNFLGNFNPLALIKFTLIVTVIVVGVCVFILTYFYIIYQRTVYNYVLYSTVDSFSTYFDYFRLWAVTFFSVHFTLDGFGLVLLNLAVFIGLISLLSLDSRFY